ncbi:hypothetical protein L208DRAFT_1419460 [Tricholoma matsutake]|nr:hypothetical protein L208DRAFT_1419460 [Tricholoma matsutake 945]
MVISLAALVFSTILSLIICQMLINKNKKLDADEKAALEGANQVMIAEAAHLEGITFKQALERRKGYQYLY